MTQWSEQIKNRITQTMTEQEWQNQLRVRFRTLLREEVARTVETESDVEAEIRHLCAALAAGSK